MVRSLTLAALTAALTFAVTAALIWPVSALAKLKKGDAFPAVAISTLDGKGKVDLASLKGKVVIVDFWASWCEPCKIELPALNALYKKYKDKGLIIVGVSLDEKREDASGFLKEHPVQFPIAYDGGDKKVLADKAEIETMPTSFIIDKKGMIAVRHQAFRAGDEVKIEKEIVRLLKGN